MGMITIADKILLARLLGPISRRISHGSPMSPGELEALLQQQGYKQSREALCEIQSWQQILSLARGQPSKAKQAQSQLEARGIPIAPCTLAVQTAVAPQQQPVAKPATTKTISKNAEDYRKFEEFQRERERLATIAQQSSNPKLQTTGNVAQSPSNKVQKNAAKADVAAVIKRICKIFGGALIVAIGIVAVFFIIVGAPLSASNNKEAK
jgi:hypothetical protein